MLKYIKLLTHQLTKHLGKQKQLKMIAFNSVIVFDIRRRWRLIQMTAAVFDIK